MVPTLTVSVFLSGEMPTILNDSHGLPSGFLNCSLSPPVIVKVPVVVLMFPVGPFIFVVNTPLLTMIYSVPAWSHVPSMSAGVKSAARAVRASAKTAAQTTAEIVNAFFMAD